MTPEQIRDWIKAGMPGCEVTVEGDGRHFYAVVIDASFAGKTLLQQQRMVYATVRARLDSGEIHALSVKTWTPEDYKKASPLPPGEG